MKQIKAILIGGGARGAKAYAPYALEHPEEIKFVAIAEPIDIRRTSFQKEHHIEDCFAFNTYEDMLKANIEADVCFVCTPDYLHFKPAMMSFEQGYNVVLEKPISSSYEECEQIEAKARELSKDLIVCHVLRYTPFFNKMKEIIDSGEIGEVVSITHNENVGFWHAAHSYVRGNWRNEENSNPMLLAKSCHDIDILMWLVGSKCTKVSSFGNLKFFREECAPAGSSDRCLNNCAVQEECPFDAAKIYLNEDVKEWPVTVITEDISIESRIKALKEGPYGRCVFRCDNNVVDHQVVNLEFENGVTVSFSMNSLSSEICRNTTVFGTKGQLCGKMEDGIIYKNLYLGKTCEKVVTASSKQNAYGHGGGDYALMESICSHFSGNDGVIKTSGWTAVESHKICFLAEEARHNSKVILL